MNEDFYGQFKFQYQGIEYEVSFKGKRPNQIILGEFRLLNRVLSNGQRDIDNEYAVDVDVFFGYFNNMIGYLHNAGAKYNPTTKLEVIDQVCQHLLLTENQILLYKLEIQIDILMYLIYKLETELCIELSDNEYSKVFGQLTDYCLAKYEVLIISSDNSKLITVQPMYDFLNQ